MNYLFISNNGESAPIAWRLEGEGHSVVLYLHNQKFGGCYDGMLGKVKLQGLEGAVDEADLIVFDMNKPIENDHDKKLQALFGAKGDGLFGSVADALREQGRRVMGASAWGEEIELDRRKGSDLARSIGLAIPETHEFDSLREGADFLKGRSDLWVFKPFENQDLDLTYVEKYPGELLAKLQGEYSKRLPDSTEFILQEKIEGHEIDCEAFWTGSKWVCQNHTIEDKHFLTGNLGPHVGSMNNTVWLKRKRGLLSKMFDKLIPHVKRNEHVGPMDVNVIVSKKDHKPYFLEWTCYDDKTEVLTLDGWKLFKNVDAKNDFICTLNPKTDCIEYHKPTDHIEKDYNGSMVQIKANNKSHHNLDVLVTPNHQMYFRRSDQKHFDFVSAEDLPRKGGVLKRIAKWKGKDQTVFTLPLYIENHVNNRHNIVFPIEHSAIEIDMKAWLRFFGLYLAEGCLGGNGRQLQISQNRKNQKNTDSIIGALPFKYGQSSSGYRISKTQLVEYFQKLNLGKCNEKFIPKEFKELDVQYLQALFDGLVIGDGTVHKRTKQISYVTTSKRLADDIQEIIMKLGYVSNIRKFPTKGTETTIRGKTYIRNFDQYVLSIRKQDGAIRSAEKFLPKKIQYNGKVYCLNVPNHIMYVRRNGRPLFCGNSRPGFDGLFCFLTLLKSPLSTFFECVSGMSNKAPQFKRGYASSIRISIPPYPYEDKDLLERAEDVPISGDVSDMWLQDVYQSDDGLVCTGCDGIIGVLAQHGWSISDSAKKVYRAAEKLKIGSYLQYRTDLGARCVDAMKTLKQWNIGVS